MPKKTQARWREYGFDAINPPAVEFSEEQLAELEKILNIPAGTKRIVLSERLTKICERFLLQKELNDITPTRTETNAAYRDILAASKDLEIRFRELDFVTLRGLEAALSDTPYVDDASGREDGGHAQYRKLRARLEHFNRVAHQTHEKLKTARGRTKNMLLRDAISELAELYEDVTGRRVTHSASDKGVYDGQPHSQFGEFAKKALSSLRVQIIPESISSITAEIINKRNYPKSDE